MTTETATLIQAITSILQTTFAFLQTVLIAATLLYAYRESSKWRSQVVGTKAIELSYQLSDTIHAIDADLTRLGIEYERASKRLPGQIPSFPARKAYLSNSTELILLQQKVTPVKYKHQLEAVIAKIDPLVDRFNTVGQRMVARERLDQKDMDFMGLEGDQGTFQKELNEIVASYLAICEEMRRVA